MSYKRYVATVLVDGHSYVGEKRARRSRAGPAAAREALKVFGKPYKSHVSNLEVTASLKEFCMFKNWEPPEYTTERCRDLDGLGAHSLNSGHEGSIGSLERLWSQEPQLGLMVRYDGGELKGSQWEVICSITLGEASRQFTGTATSKHGAKELAAHKAYEWLSEQLRGSVSAHTSLSFADAPIVQIATEVPSRCIEVLRQVCHNLQEPLQGEVMAAILMTRPGHQAKIVCIGSGTGFINQQNLVLKDGQAIFDCHAEVLARRGLQAFLFKQVESASKGDTASIVCKIGENFSLNKGVRFHLFVSKVPCGDACMPMNTKDAGCLRYRRYNGEGNLLKAEGCHLQYKICCSAKIALWNVVGLQGALLAQVLGPVYLSTIIVQGAEDAHREDHACKATLERAFFGRLQNVRDLPPGYRVNRPVVVVLPSVGGANGGSGHSKHLAVCWAAGCEKGEVIETTKGLRKKGDLDVSKRGFANRWVSLYPDDKRKTFRAVKRNAGDYQRAKQEVEACLPGWIHKSPEYDSFNI